MPLNLQRVDRGQIGVELDETVRVAEIGHPFLGREREMIIATRADALVLGQLDFVHHFAAAGAFLPKSLRHVALLAVVGPERWFFENGHESSRGRRLLRAPKAHRLSLRPRRIRSKSNQ